MRIPNIRTDQLGNDDGNENVPFNLPKTKRQSTNFCSSNTFCGVGISISVMLVIGTLIAATYQIVNIGNGTYSIVYPKY